MFVLNSCAAGCGRPAITGSALCAIHSANSHDDALRLTEFILNEKYVKDISAQGLHFEGVDFSKRQFYGCNFSGATFSMCLFTETEMLRKTM